MPQDTISALSNLISLEIFAKLLADRQREGSDEAPMTFEAFEVKLG
jgi:hypothetical protein